jgi:hypothetical protein
MEGGRRKSVPFMIQANKKESVGYLHKAHGFDDAEKIFFSPYIEKANA